MNKYLVALCLVAFGAFAGVLVHQNGHVIYNEFSRMLSGDVLMFRSNSTNVTLCSNSPCQHGGTCYSYGNYSYSCLCPDQQWYGTNCEDDWSKSPCSYYPGGVCANGGICYPTRPNTGFYCSCQPGWRGEQCFERYDSLCSSYPCQNGGTCNDMGGNSYYYCSCAPGFMGVNCSITSSQTACASNPCLNYGTCYDYGNSYSCMCAGGYYGSQCEMRSNDACSMYSCQNGGSCYNNGYGGFNCMCAAGYSGSQCQTYLPSIESICYTSNPCFHGGTCVASPWAYSYTCICPYGYTGYNCDQSSTPSSGCNMIPCTNGGSCLTMASVDGSPLSLCACASGFAGKQCEYREVVVGGRSIYYITTSSVHGFTWLWTATATDAITGHQGVSGHQSTETVALQYAITDLFRVLVASNILSANHAAVHEAMTRFAPVEFSDDVVHATLNVGALLE